MSKIQIFHASVENVALCQNFFQYILAHMVLYYPIPIKTGPPLNFAPLSFAPLIYWQPQIWPLYNVHPYFTVNLLFFHSFVAFFLLPLFFALAYCAYLLPLIFAQARCAKIKGA